MISRCVPVWWHGPKVFLEADRRIAQVFLDYIENELGVDMDLRKGYSHEFTLARFFEKAERRDVLEGITLFFLFRRDRGLWKTGFHELS